MKGLVMIVYRDDKIEIKLGDKLSLKLADIEKHDPFFHSNVGEKFKHGICDEIKIEVKQYEWLEIYFETALYKNGEHLTNDVVYNNDNSTDLHSEKSSYPFLRYLLGKGLKIEL